MDIDKTSYKKKEKKNKFMKKSGILIEFCSLLKHNKSAKKHIFVYAKWKYKH